MNLSFPSMNHSPAPYKILYSEPKCESYLTEQMIHHIAAVPYWKDIIVLCIGTDRSTGDSLGPLIGSKLKALKLSFLNVYGDLDEPVHAVNLEENIQQILQRYKDPYIIAIDACLGQLTSVGYIQIGKGPLKPGAGVNKTLPEVGDIYVTGVVNVGGFMEYFVLQNTRLSLVMNMADTIASSIHKAITTHHQNRLTSLTFLE